MRLSVATVVLRSAIWACTSTAQCSIHNAAELDEEAVTRRLDEPAVTHGDSRLEQLGPYRPEGLESTALIRPDQPRNIPIQNIVLSPTSTSYFRTKVSLDG